MKLSKVFSARMRELRETTGMSQQDLAVKADLSLSQVSKLEQGKKADPRVSTLLRLAAALGVTPGQVLDDLPLPAEEPKKQKVKKAKKAGKKKKKKRGDGKTTIAPTPS